MSHRVATFVSLARAAAVASSPLIVDTLKKKPKEYPEWGTPDFYWRIGISICFVLLGGVFAGLTLGLMGLDELHLRVLRTSSDDATEVRLGSSSRPVSLSYTLEQRENAAKVLRLLKRGRHWVLVVSLLIALDQNVCVTDCRA